MSEKLPPRAVELHEQGRAAAGQGDPVRALELLHEAHLLVPDWPYPPYDMAFTYLLADHLDEAEKWYAHVDKLAPRGFFTAKTALYVIRCEKRGDVPSGFAKAFAMLEWEEPDDRRAAYRQITKVFPAFAPAWKELAMLLDDDSERLAAIETGLACSPDDETFGVLTLNKALILQNRGERAAATQLAASLVGDPRCTDGARAMAKAAFGDALSGRS